jgi:hypothetical protein
VPHPASCQYTGRSIAPAAALAHIRKRNKSTVLVLFSLPPSSSASRPVRALVAPAGCCWLVGPAIDSLSHSRLVFTMPTMCVWGGHGEDRRVVGRFDLLSENGVGRLLLFCEPFLPKTQKTKKPKNQKTKKPKK